MSLSYDTSLFERTREGLFDCGPSQRLKRICSMVYNQFSFLTQLGLGKNLISVVSRPLAYVLLFLYLVLVSGLFLLIVKQLSSSYSQQQQYDDVNLFGMINNRHRYIEKIGRSHLLRIIFSSLNFVIFFAAWNESLSKDFFNFHFLILFYSVIFYGLYNFYKNKLRGEHAVLTRSGFAPSN